MIARLRRQLGRRLPTTAALLAALALGACQTNGTGKPVASGAISGSKAIAFESIDGPPQPVFDKLVASLATEAKTQQVAVVSRQSKDAPYRVRGYFAAAVQNGQGEVDWVWDVFDADRERVLRVAGTEKVGAGKDVWNKLDDETVSRIAAKSLDEISTRLAAGPPPSRPATPPSPEEIEAAPPVQPGDTSAVAAAEPDEPGAAVADTAVAAPGTALTFAAHP